MRRGPDPIPVLRDGVLRRPFVRAALSRRSLLQVASVAALGAFSGVLAACTTSTPDDAPRTAAAASPSPPVSPTPRPLQTPAPTVHPLASLVSSADVDEIVRGLQLLEGPVWHPGGYLLFSDIVANRIMKWTPPDRLEVFREQSGGPATSAMPGSNGLDLDRRGRLIACEHSNRRISRTELDGSITVLADRYDGKRFNRPNDVVVRSDGTVYFTDPGPPFAGAREIEFQGVFGIRPAGEVFLVASDFAVPNGLDFSPDESALYVTDSGPDRLHLRRLAIRPDGTAAGSEVFADFSSQPGRPDGMAVDAQGNLYVTVARGAGLGGVGGVQVLDRSGKQLGTIATPQAPRNCAFGGPNGTTLFITAITSVYRVEMRVKGRGP